jgi:hypothetical protein
MKRCQATKHQWTYIAFFLFWALQSMMNLDLLRLLPAIVKSFSTVKAFCALGPLTPRSCPNLEGQGIPFCLDHHLWPVRHGRPCQLLRYRRHSSQDHMTTQAPPLRQSRDTYGGIQWISNYKSRISQFRGALPKVYNTQGYWVCGFWSSFAFYKHTTFRKLELFSLSG